MVARINALAYGSPLPDRVVWSSHFQAHYERVDAAIPEAQLLRVSVADVRRESPYPRICAFLGLAAAQCPTTPYPRTNALADRRKPSPASAGGEGEPAAAPIRAPFAYATMLADDSAP